MADTNFNIIFQRAIDNLLKEHIGKHCLVYIDNVIIYLQDKEYYLVHVGAVLSSLLETNFEVSVEKSRQNLKTLVRISKEGLKSM